MKHLLLIALLFGQLHFSGATPPLFENGSANWKIYLPANPDPVEQYAAEELAQFLQKSSGAVFQIVSGGEIPDSQAIILGTIDSMPQVKLHAEALQLAQGGEQKTAVYTLNGNLYLAGRTSRGVLQSVYTFLTKELKIRWFWPETEAGGEFVPKLQTYSPSQLAINHDPAIRYRGYHFLNGTNAKLEAFLARNHGNLIRHGTAGGAERIQERAKMGFYLYISGHNIDPSASMFKDQIDTLFAEHPEYFAEYQGKRVKDQFCWTNPAAEDMLVAKFVQFIKDSPGIEIMGFYPADNQNYCGCKTCRLTDDSTNYFKLLRRITDRLKQQYPQLRFAAIAYQGYKSYPKCDMEGYEFIEYALYGRCFVHLLDDSACEVNQQELKEWKNWLKSGIQTGIYGYEFDILIPTMAIPLHHWIAEELRNFKANNVVAVLPEISGTYPGKIRNERFDARKDMRLSFYLYTQLMWDPDQSVDDLIRDFCTYVYPAAADEMVEYHTLMSQKWLNMQQHFTGYFNYPVSAAAQLLNQESIDRIFTLFANAEAKLKQSGNSQALSQLDYEKSKFGEWLKYYYQNSENTFSVPRQEAALMKLGPGVNLGAIWSDNALQLGVAATGADSVTATLYRPNGSKETISAPFQNGKAYLLWQDSLQPGDCRELKLQLIKDGQAITSSALSTVLYCANADRIAKRLLFSTPQDPQSEKNRSTIRTVFLENNFQADVSSNIKTIQAADLNDYNIVAIRLNNNKLPNSFYRSKLLPFVNKGGIAILSANEQFDFGRIFGNPSFRLNWTKEQHYNWKLRMVQSLEPGSWLNSPDNLEKQLKMLCTPYSGFEIPSGSKWKSLATMRKTDGQSAPFILEMKYGEGVIILTTGTLGLGNDGAWMSFGSSHPESVSALFNNIYHNYGAKNMKLSTAFTLFGLTLAISVPAGENLVKFDKWQPYEKTGSIVIDKEKQEITCTNTLSNQKSNLTQRINLNQTEAKKITFSAESKAENVTGNPNGNYCLYMDIFYTDGTKKWGVNVPFKVGTHDWEKIEGSIPAEKPIKSIALYLCFRHVGGKAFFKNITLSQE